jgi:hypothetical protein
MCLKKSVELAYGYKIRDLLLILPILDAKSGNKENKFTVRIKKIKQVRLGE